MEGYLAGIASGIQAILMVPTHPMLAVIASVSFTVAVLAFWTGVVGVKFERG